MDLNTCDIPDSVLFICTAHQVNQERSNYLIENLKKLKFQNLDVCVCTHSDFALDKIADFCDYLIYDKNNSVVSLQCLLDNLNFVSLENLNSYFHSFYSAEGAGFSHYLKIFFWESHSKPALSNFKNGVDLAASKDYKWIVYFEYDVAMPEVNLKNHFNLLIKFLKSSNKNGLAYLCPDGRYPLVWPFFFIAKTEIFSNDFSLKSNWQRCDSKYLNSFGIKCFEEILTKIINQNNFILMDSSKVKSDFNYEFDDLNKTSVFSHASLDANFYGKRQLLDFYDSKLFCRKLNEEEYEFDVWLFVHGNIPNVKAIEISIFENDKIISEFRPEDIFTLGWRNQKVNKKYRKESDNLIKLQMDVKLISGVCFCYSYSFNTSSIDKYHLIFNTQ
jgi:hypothetical protein